MNDCFHIHDLLTLTSVETTPSAQRFLDMRLGRFARAGEGNADEADILLAPLGPGHPLYRDGVKETPPHEMGLFSYEGRPAFLFYHRGKPDYAVQFGPQLKLFYHPAAVRFGDMLTLLMGRALAKGGGLLCHGASVEREGTLATIMGPPMLKKTMLLLHLLAEGWRFVSDDLFILSGGSVYALESSLAVRGDHLKTFPWLEERVPRLRSFEGATARRRALLRFAHNRLPGYLLPLVERFSPNQFCVTPLTRLFPDCKPVEQGTLTHALLLAPSHEPPALSPMSHQKAATNMAVVQRLFPKKYRFFQSFAQLADENASIPYESILESNLAGARCFRLAAPVLAPFGAVARLAEEALT